MEDFQGEGKVERGFAEKNAGMRRKATIIACILLYLRKRSKGQKTKLTAAKRKGRGTQPNDSAGEGAGAQTTD